MIGTRVFAPAKINLALHITGQRADGYHLLDSLVAFAGVGDTLEILLSGFGDISVTGPETEGVPTDHSNLIMHVAAAFWKPVSQISFYLEKHLPAAAGIGGGSADAAACYRGLLNILDGREGAHDLLSTNAARRLLEMGADIPMCVLSDPVRVQGIGEHLTPVPTFPEFPIVLVNPRVSVPTGAVFSALDRKDNPPMEPLPQDPSNPGDVIEWLARQRNDLEAPALGYAPPIADALDTLRMTNGCRLARMSGSGATCFALYDSSEDAQQSAIAIADAHPSWWVKASTLNGGRRAEPQEIRATT